MKALEVDTDRPSGLPQHSNKLRPAAAGAREWLTAQLTGNSLRHLTSIRLILICAVVFLSAAGVRVLHWQDEHVEIISGKTSLSGVFNRYNKEARRMLEERRILFPRELPVAGDARMLTHPPGYSIILAAVEGITDNPYPALWLLQIVGDGLAAVLVFLIAGELLNWLVAAIAAMLVAISPHLAHYSLLPLPDSQAVLPILVAVYLVTKARKRPNIGLIIAAGACVGLSCWLRANALLLAPFLSVAIFLVFERKRLLYACALTATTIVVISPITVRNLVVFHRFIPLSIQAGLNLVEGLGDFDPEGKLGMPRSDREARLKDAEWHDRPEYAATLWSPDGIARDRARFDRGLSVIRSNPGWFAGVTLRRAAFMLSYNESRAREWPLSTASVRPVSAQAGYGHPIETAGVDEPIMPASPVVLVLNGSVIHGSLSMKNDRESVKAIAPVELNATGTVLSQAVISLREDGQVFDLTGDNSDYADQFESAPIPVKKNTDYVLLVPVSMLHGDMALKVASVDRRIALAVSGLTVALKEGQSLASRPAPGNLPVRSQMTLIQMPFASGDRTEIRLVLSNGVATEPPAVRMGQAEIFESGPTPSVWTRYPRLIVRSIQRKFTTALMRALIAGGIALLLLARRGRTLALLLVVPAYYLVVQSPLHTEYRYILAIHYFLMGMAAVTLFCLGSAIVQASSSMAKRLGIARAE